MDVYTGGKALPLPHTEQGKFMLALLILCDIHMTQARLPLGQPFDSVVFDFFVKSYWYLIMIILFYILLLYTKWL